jgi:HEAT repeat protein
MTDWIKDLSDNNAEVRRGAAFALGKIGGEGDPRQAMDALTHSLGDKDAAVRDFAASGLGDVLMVLGNAGKPYWSVAGPALRAALKDGQPRVRRSAAYALGAFGPDAAPARDDLITAAGDSSPIVRQNAAWALGRLGKEIGDDGVAQLRNLLKDTDEPLVRRDALHALGEVGYPTAHPAVRAMLQTAAAESDGVVRKAAVEALDHLVGKEDREYASELYPLLKDKDSETRYNAAFVLGKIGGKEAVPALPALVEALKDQDPHFQELAAAALQSIGPDAAPAVEALGDALTNAKESKVRTNAALALAHIGPPAAKAMPQILQALQYSETDGGHNVVRPYAAEALVGINFPSGALNPDVIPAIPEVLKIVKADPDVLVRQRCLWVLFDVEDLDKYNITPVLTAVLQETDKGSALPRYDAARVLALRLRDKAPDKTADVLLDMLTNSTLVNFYGTEAKVSGVGAEGAGGKSEVKTNQGGDARYMAAQALGWLGRKANRPDIIRALQDATQDKDARLSAAAKQALQSIK